MSAPREAGRTHQSPRTRGLALFSALAWLLLLFSALPGFAQTYVTSYTNAANSVNEPTFVALDNVGGTTYLYVSNHGDATTGSVTPPPNGGDILKINVSTGATTIIATRGQTPGHFISPDSILVDPSTHNLFIADRWQNNVQEITNTGTFVMAFGSGTVGAPDEMHGPVGLARDGSGAIYVSEHGDTNGAGNVGNMVSKYTVSGTTATRVWRKGNGLNVPYSVAVNGSNLFISDGFNDQVQVWDLNGNPVRSFPVSAIALGSSFDAAGNLWLGEATGNTGGTQTIVKRNPATGAALLTFGTPGTGNGQFALPFDVVVDSAANKAYVADYNNSRVQVFDLSAPPPSGGVPVINSSASASGTVGVNFSYQLSATNSPTSYAAVDALPSGLTLDTASGAVTGIPSTSGTTTTHFTATNSSGTSAQFAVTFTIAAASGGTPGTPAAPVGPTITSFVLDTRAGQITLSHAHMLLTFDTSVTGVDQSDFVVHATGSTSATITGVSGSGANYQIDFDYVDAAGSIQMAIKTSGTGITDGSGNAFRGNGITASPVYGTHSATPPAAPQALSLTAGTPSGNNVTFTVTFDQTVTNVDASDFIITGTSATVGAVSGSGTTYTVPVTASGSGTVTLTVIGGATANIQDSATNWFGGVGNTSASATISGSTGGGGGTASVPVVSNATVTGTVGTPIANVQVNATNSPTSFSAPNLATYGLSISNTGVISGTPTMTATNATVNVTATNSAGTSAAATITLNISAASSGGGTTSVPVVSNASVTGTVGTPIANVQVNATNSPTSFSAPGLATYGLSISNTGVISGTPTTTATSATVNVTATNSAGTSAPATITLNISAASSGGGGGTTSIPVVSNASVTGTVGTPIANVQVNATNSPTSFSAPGLATYGLSISNTGVISGTPTTAANGATVSVTASNSAGASTAATITLNIHTSTAGGGVTVGAPIVFSASLTVPSGAAMQYQVTATNHPTAFKLWGAPDDLTISSTGLITGTPIRTGTYLLIVTATNSSGASAGTITLNVGSAGSTKKTQTVSIIPPVSDIFVGQTLALSATSSSGLPVTYAVISGDGTLIGNNLVINSAGSVTVRAAQAGDATYAAASADATFTAIKRAQSVNLSSIPTMTHTDGKLTLSATADSGLPITYSVVSGPATVSGNTVTFTGTGTVVIRAVQSGNSQYDSATNNITIAANPVPRLINISTRAKVSAGDADGATIAGFVVTGTTPKQILVRAVGPGLTAFGIKSPLADPTLKLFDSKGNVVATNSGWNDDAQVSAAGDSAGAFKLAKGSKDAAILATLQPGAYTVQVQSTANNGTVLIEVYDVTANAAVPTKQLINISTRGMVGTGDDALIGGFVVSGNESKKVLIRAVGPGLSTYGVNGVLSDPIVTVYKDGAVIATNDNWGTQTATGSVVSSKTAADITAADTASGAFPLASGSADAALVLTLQPGNYTVIVSGASNGTGNALMEVYEVSNP